MSIRPVIALPALAAAVLLGGCGTYLHAHRYDDGMHPAATRQAGMQRVGMEGCAMQRRGGMQHDGMQHGGMQHGGMQQDGKGCGGMAMSGDGAGKPMRDRMCEMHREMTAGKTPAEQQAAIEEHIRAMHGMVTAEMLDQHRTMMEKRCAPSAAASATR